MLDLGRSDLPKQHWWLFWVVLIPAENDVSFKGGSVNDFACIALVVSDTLIVMSGHPIGRGVEDGMRVMSLLRAVVHICPATIPAAF